MIRASSRRWAVVLSMAVVAASFGSVSHAGWGDKALNYRYLTPPNNEIPSLKRIAVMDFEGAYGRVVSDRMVEALGDARDRLQKYPWDASATPQIIEPIERSRLQAVITEQKLGSQGIVDDTGAAKIGAILGVDAMVFGSTTEDVKDTREVKQVTYTENKQTYTRNVTYYTRTAKLSAQGRVVEPSTGKVLATLSDSAERSKTEVDPVNLPNGPAMLDEAARQVGYGFGLSFSPGTGGGSATLEKVKSLLKEKADRSKRDKVEDDCKAAIEAAASGRMEEAWRIYMAAFSLDEYNPLIASNIGALYEAIGDYENALKYFKIAQEYNSEEASYRAAASRVGYEMNVRAKLNQLGFIEKPRTFNPEAARLQIASATIPKLRVVRNGARLYSEPSKTASSVGSLPKEMTLEILEEKTVEKDLYYHVKTATGKEGWLHEDDIEKL